jgi:hypothetical protein
MARQAGSDSRPDFFRGERFAIFGVSGQQREPKEISAMSSFGPFVSRLSVVTAYVAFAFVGAIVLGVF